MEEKTMYAWRDDDLRTIPVQIRSDGAIVLPDSAQHLFGYRRLIWQKELIFDTPQEALENAQMRLRQACDSAVKKAMDLEKNLAYLQKCAAEIMAYEVDA